MKNVLIIAMTSCLMVASCKPKKDIADSEQEATSVSTASAVDSILDAASVTRDEERMEYCTGNANDSLLLTLERTPCFGRCPTYEAKIYCSGYVEYIGKNFTPRLGTYEGIMPQEDILDITNKADSIGFWSLDKVYDANVTDLPSTITMIHYADKKHTVKNRFQAPDELEELEDLIDEKLNQISWSKKSSNH